MATTSAAQPKTNENSPYDISSRQEIAKILRDLIDKNQLIRMVIDNGAQVVMTTVLDVDLEANSVIIDSAPNPFLNQRVVEAEKIHFETTLDRIGIFFSTSNAKICTFEARPALQIKIPKSLTRLQKREYYRIPTPLANPVNCVIPLPEGMGEGCVTLPLIDLSCGGLAIYDEHKNLDIEIGCEYPDCRIDLPKIGSIIVTLQVRYGQDITLLNRKNTRRIGFQFVNLSKSILTGIQRYIMQVERERNARATGMG